MPNYVITYFTSKFQVFVQYAALKLKIPLVSKAINCLLGVNFTGRVMIILEKKKFSEHSSRDVISVSLK